MSSPLSVYLSHNNTCILSPDDLALARRLSDDMLANCKQYNVNYRGWQANPYYIGTRGEVAFCKLANIPFSLLHSNIEDCKSGDIPYLGCINEIKTRTDPNACLLVSEQNMMIADQLQKKTNSVVFFALMILDERTNRATFKGVISANDLQLHGIIQTAKGNRYLAKQSDLHEYSHYLALE